MTVRQEREVTFPHNIRNGLWKQGHPSNRAIYQNQGPVDNNLWFMAILVEQYHLFVGFSVQEEEMKHGKGEEGTDSGAL